MNDEIIIYCKCDSNGSIIAIKSDIFIDDLSGWEQIDEWKDGEDRYLYAHADNGEYVKQKHGKPLFDEQGIPNYHGNWVEWTEEEKQEKYPTPEPEPSELEQLKKRQEITEQALQDLILMTLGGE